MDIELYNSNSKEEFERIEMDEFFERLKGIKEKERELRREFFRIQKIKK